ncbi:MAG TPA: FAD-binding oxidoreductase [Steroidobacteraceae bacterium]|nr:FAD-binding oxidoreductase [Steroidobacteraceae bacterium]
MTPDHADILVIGAGIAGASVAAHLAESRSVILMEREQRPGYHSTGRSAALFTEIYGNATIRALTRASRRFLYEAPPEFSEVPLTRRRGCLYIATPAQLEALHAFHALPDIAPATRMLPVGEAHELCPILRRGYVAGALLEPDCADIDVHALHQGYLRLFKQRDGRLLNDAAVHSLAYDNGVWTVQAGRERLTAPLIVNAAGAWADQVAGLAGISPIGLTACRRTAVLVDAPEGLDIGGWPFVSDIDEQFYFRPDAGSIFLSPADETPTEPADVQPEEWDIAAAVERLEQATTLQVRRLKARWAGLRTFAPDRTPVVGYSPILPAFFWLAGQGGYGIQTAPALSRAAAALVLGLALPADLQDQGLEAAMSPARFGAIRGLYPTMPR